MPRQNIIFAIVAPLILMAIIAAIVVSIGETLLTVHELADEAYHVGAYATAEENQHWGEIAAIYPVVVALVIATVFLIGGAIASRLMPQRPSSHH
jgi:ABC-type Na+ efflux pump permease subunit